MKKRKWWFVGSLFLIIAYLGGPVVLQLFYDWGYNKNDLEHMEIIGHRGGASLGPENTLACYQSGIKAGADMIEIDIHLTKDRQIVICHDQTLDRTTNGEGKIRDLTLDEIRQYRIVDADGNLTTEKIPTLDEVFDLLLKTRAGGNPCKLLIEIKRTNNIYQGIEELLLQKINSYQAKDWVIVQSFNDFALEKIHQLDPTIRLEKLFFFKLPGLPIIMDWFHFTTFSYEKYSYISSFNMNYRWLTKSFLNEIHQHGKEVKVWTLEGTDVPHMDVDGIITNRPDLWCLKKGNNMEVSDILKKADAQKSDADKLSMLGNYIGKNLDSLTAKDFIQLLPPLVDITKRMYEVSPSLDQLTDYTIAMTKLAENLIIDDQSWKAKPLLQQTEALLNEKPDTKEYAQWKFNTYYQIGECYYINQRRQQAKDAFKHALSYAKSAEQDTGDCEYRLQQLENPTLAYDPVEDSEAYLAVIDEVERRLYEELKDEPRHMGFCFRYWSAKRDLLKEYGIEWHSPSTMNPGVMFD